MPGSWTGSGIAGIITPAGHGQPAEGDSSMYKRQPDAKQLRICYIGGGSRGWAWKFMGDLAMDPDMGGEVRLYDIDESAARRNEIIGNKIMAHPDAKVM